MKNQCSKAPRGSVQNAWTQQPPDISGQNRLAGESASAAEIGSQVLVSPRRRFFNPHQWDTIVVLCECIIPRDSLSEGAIAASVPDFIDLLTSENRKYQLRIEGGLMWLDSLCRKRYGLTFVNCSDSQRKRVLDLIAYRNNLKKNPEMSHGVEFFAFFRRFTVDGYFTSQIGINFLQYMGNSILPDFSGCASLLSCDLSNP
jgi:gluconate 2-dehydrogenase gamma chain